MSVLVVGHLPQLRPGRPARAGRARRATALHKLVARRRGLRARHRGHRHRDLQPGRDLRRGRPLPRQRRGALAAARRARRRRRPRRSLPHLYVHYDDGAVSHLFHVAAGLDSMAVGEGQILGQTREALRRGQEQRHRRPGAQRRCSSRRCGSASASRAETDIDRAAPSLVAAALDRVERHGRRARRRARSLVVGAGVDGRRWPPPPSPARGAAEVVVVNRTAEQRRPARRASTARRAVAARPTSPPSWPRADVRHRLHRRRRRARHRAPCVAAARAERPRRWPSSTWRCRTTSSPPVADLPGVTPDRPGRARRRAARHRGRPRGRRRSARSSPRRSPPSSPRAARPASPRPWSRCARWPPRSSTPRCERLVGPAARPRRRRPRRGRCTPCAGSPTSCSTSRPSGSRSWPTRPARSPTPPRSPSCSRSTPRPSTPSPGREGPVHERPVTAAAPRHPRLAARHAPSPSSVADADRASALGREVELVEVTTEGDRQPAAAAGQPRRHRRLRQRAARRAAARRGRRRRALAQGPADRTRTTASRWPPCPPREDPRDVVVARDGLTLGELPVGSRVGTGSPRRVAQLHALGLGLEVVGHPRQRRHPDRQGPVRASYDAVVLARAGLARLGRLDEVTEVLDPLQMLPAPGQGALAVECRADDPTSATALRAPSTTRAPRAAVDGRARRARHPRGRVLGPDRRAGRGGRGRGRRRALGPGGRPVPRRGAVGADVRVRRPRRRRRASGPGWPSEMLADGAARPDRRPGQRPRQRSHDQTKRQRRMTRGKTTTPTDDRHRPRVGVLRGQRPRRPRPAHRACRRPAPARPTSWSPRSPSTSPGAHAARARRARRGDRRPAEPASRPGPEFVDGGFGEDGQPLTHAARAKVVVRQAKKRPPRGPADGRRPVPLRLRSRGGAGLRQGRPRLRDRPRRLLGRRGPGVRRHPADHQGPPRGRRRHLRRARSTGAGTPTTARWCCSRPSARSATSPRRWSPRAAPPRPRSR